MIPALTELRRELGQFAHRRLSRAETRRWITSWLTAERMAHELSEHDRNLAACPDHLLGGPDAEQRGRMVRMEQAVLLGWIQGMTHNTKREEP